MSGIDHDNRNLSQDSANCDKSPETGLTLTGMRDRQAREYAARPATALTWGLNRHVVEKLFADGWDACGRCMWLDASVVLPPVDEDVLAHCQYSDRVAYHDGVSWYDSNEGTRLRPSHWMPIPPRRKKP